MPKGMYHRKTTKKKVASAKRRRVREPLPQGTYTGRIVYGGIAIDAPVTASSPKKLSKVDQIAMGLSELQMKVENLHRDIVRKEQRMQDTAERQSFKDIIEGAVRIQYPNFKLVSIDTDFDVNSPSITIHGSVR